MKFPFVFISIFILSCCSVANAASKDDGYMEGHPSYNKDYYNPSYNRNDFSPDYDSDYYNKKYNYNGRYDDNSNDAPHGNDIRDYNQYYNRDGSLK